MSSFDRAKWAPHGLKIMKSAAVSTIFMAASDNVSPKKDTTTPEVVNNSREKRGWGRLVVLSELVKTNGRHCNHSLL